MKSLVSEGEEPVSDDILKRSRIKTVTLRDRPLTPELDQMDSAEAKEALKKVFEKD